MRNHPVLLLSGLCLVGALSTREASRDLADIDACAGAAGAVLSPERLFFQATREHREELRNLIALRGESAYRLRADSGGITTREVSRVLSVRFSSHDAEVAVLFYSFGPGVLRTWLVGENRLLAYDCQSTTPAAIDSAIQRLRITMGISGLQSARAPKAPDRTRSEGVGTRTTADSVGYSVAVRHLTDLLLPSGLWQALMDVDHLIVVPTHSIAVAPFALLQPFSKHVPLIEHTSVSIAPSLYDIGQEADRWRGWDAAFEGPAVVVGNPRIVGQPDGWTFPALPGAAAEARKVAERLDVVPLLGEAARKDTVVSRAARASVIYLATHGVSSATNALDSSFVLLTNAADSPYRWTAREIQRTPLQARIVVLSACQTGLGQSHDAGLIGLARAFQLAGVPRVLVSLWNVDDAATAELMLDFVRFAQNEYPAGALQHAINVLRARRPNPIYWASFALFGLPI